MTAVTEQPVSHSFGSTISGLPRGLECLSTLTELLIIRDYTKTLYGVLNSFTICDATEKELLVAKDDFNIRTLGHWSTNVLDNNEFLMMTLKQTWRLCDTTYQIIGPNGRLLGDMKSVCDPFIRRLRDSYGSTVATFRFLCFSGSCGEIVWQIRDPDGSEIGRLVFLAQWCGSPRHFRLNFYGDLDTERKALVLGASLIIILQCKLDEGQDG